MCTPKSDPKLKEKLRVRNLGKVGKGVAQTNRSSVSLHVIRLDLEAETLASGHNAGRSPTASCRSSVGGVKALQCWRSDFTSPVWDKLIFHADICVSQLDSFPSD